jgi:dTDP-4-dehydrorhamnose reductase
MVVGAAQGTRNPMSKVLVVGAAGMLGTDVMSVLEHHNPRGVTRGELDITVADQVQRAVQGFDVVVNCAAYTRVDDAETDRDQAFAINSDGVANLARAAKTEGSRLIHLSTDYVFDGQGTTPLAEDAPTGGLSVYGESKRAGEENLLEIYSSGGIILRTSWLYGLHGPSFPRTILKAGREREQLQVVNDQVGQPTWTLDVAHMISMVIDSSVSSGVFHATNAGQATWWDFAQRIFRAAGWYPERIVPTTTDKFPRPAPRPAWSVLGHDNWAAYGFPAPRDWTEAFDEAWATQLHTLITEDS